MSQQNITKVYWAGVTDSFFGSRTIYIAATEHGLCRVLWPDESFDKLKDWVKKEIPGAELMEDSERMGVYIQELIEYFQGERKVFTLPLDMRGTAFRVSVWKILQQIPYGQTRNYADVAEAIGNPRAVRAVGTANGANPIPIIVPCHRVIGKNKALTGFGGGFTNKKKLLHLEGYHDYIDKGHARFEF